jgi:hypothetical protein
VTVTEARAVVETVTVTEEGEVMTEEGEVMTEEATASLHRPRTPLLPTTTTTRRPKCASALAANPFKVSRLRKVGRETFPSTQ